ncbi:hypothetical protein J43TS9_56470 [Paenibacillus cineris]|nr:hypothetical protein J43TS9_56470 [Paenibacillus cineris]
MSRTEAIQWLEARELELILTVDLFNEGVDIPTVDTLLFVRTTESLTARDDFFFSIKKLSNK